MSLTCLSQYCGKYFSDSSGDNFADLKKHFSKKCNIWLRSKLVYDIHMSNTTDDHTSDGLQATYSSNRGRRFDLDLIYMFFSFPKLVINITW